MDRAGVPPRVHPRRLANRLRARTRGRGAEPLRPAGAGRGRAGRDHAQELRGSGRGAKVVTTSRRLRIVVLGTMGTVPFAGQTWLYLNWLRGLMSLGHDVWY